MVGTRNCCAGCNRFATVLDRFRFGMLDRRLISVDGKPVKAYLLQHDVWVVSINALVLVQVPHYAPFIPLRANDHQDGMGVPFRIGRLPETTLTLKMCVWHFLSAIPLCCGYGDYLTHFLSVKLQVPSANMIEEALHL